jgi:hydroxyethylthiazole kinase-like uncharacterized protein yjeF
MPEIWTAREARDADLDAARRGIRPDWLMEAAGAAVAAVLAREARPRSVLVLAGPGQNGGDGWVAARRLALRGVVVRVWAPAGGADPLVAAAKGAGVRLVQRLDAALAASEWVVDALFGIGLNRPLADPWQEALDRVARRGKPVLAVDVCSGLAADTGQPLGRPAAARLTVTFQALKPAHLLEPGASLSGRVIVADIGLPRRAGSRLTLTSPGRFPWASLARPVDAHKYSRGRVLVIGGSAGYAGAAALAALAALRAGAGYVELLVPASASRAATSLAGLPLVVRLGAESADGTLVVDEPFREALDRARAVVVGPGLSPLSRAVVDAVRQVDRPAVVDAGAMVAWAEGEGQAWPRSVFTPHGGEAGGLLGQTADWVASHRQEAVQQLAARTGGTVLLKGRPTLVAQAGRPGLFVNPVGGPELATAGTGDVLAGVLGFLLAAGWDAAEAAAGGALWHGWAGRLAANGRGTLGVTAMDVVDALAAAWQRLARQGRGHGDRGGE